MIPFFGQKNCDSKNHERILTNFSQLDMIAYDIRTVTFVSMLFSFKHP